MRNIDQLIQEIKKRFPETTSIFNKIPQELASDRLEAFAAETMAAIDSGELDRARHYLEFIENILIEHGSYMESLIDPYYAETLFFQCTNQTAEKGWPMMPPHLKKLYLRFHGKAPDSISD